MVNVTNTYGKIKEIILGSVDSSVIQYCNPIEQPKLEYIFSKTQEELNSIQKTLESLDIIVHRPVFFDSSKQSITPFWERHGHKIPLTPRDHFLVVGDTILETASWQPESFFMSFYFRDIMRECFENGAHWLSMPMPTYDPKLEDIIDDDIPEGDPIFDAPSIMLHNDVMFMSVKGANNKLGVRWMHRHFGDQFRIIEMDSEKFKGHLDAHINIIGDGKLMTWHPKEDLPEYLKSWDIIKVDTHYDRATSSEQVLVDNRIQDDDFLNTVLATNALVLDPTTILVEEVYKDKDIKLFKELERAGIDIVFVPYTYSHFFNHGLTCATLELVRDNG